MNLYTKALDAVMKLLKFASCSQKRERMCRSKAEKRQNYPEYRVWIQNAFGIDAWEWETLETASHDLKTSGLLVCLNAEFGKAVTFVVSSEVKDLLERLYRQQEEEDYPCCEAPVLHLMFLQDSTMVNLYPAR